MTRYAQYPRVCGRLCTRFPRPCFFSSAGASDADKRQGQPIGAHKAVRRLPFPNGCGQVAIRSPKRRQGGFTAGWRRLFAPNFAFDFFPDGRRQSP